MSQEPGTPLLPFLRRWVWRPVLPAALLGIAVAVSVDQGQPPPADRASGVSVPLSAAVSAPSGIGDLLLVSDGELISYGVKTGSVRRIGLPKGEYALRAWPMHGVDIVLTQPAPVPATTEPSGRQDPDPPPSGSPTQTPTPTPNQTSKPTPTPKQTQAQTQTRAKTGHDDDSLASAATATPSPTPTVPLGTAPPAPRLPEPGESTGVTPGRGAGATTPPPAPRTSVFVISRHKAPVRLGSATAAVPAPDGAHVWLMQDDIARLVGLDGKDTVRWVRVPPGYWLVGATSGGPIATTREPEPLTVLLPPDGGLPHWLANAEALDVSDGTVLLRERHRIGSLRLATGRQHWLPMLSAVDITGPGTLATESGAFAVLARVNDHARLVVGPLRARSGDELQVVALEGGTALDHPARPVWADDGRRVLAVRPDGRMVVYRPGDPQGAVLSAEFEADGLAAARPVPSDK